MPSVARVSAPRTTPPCTERGSAAVSVGGARLAFHVCHAIAARWLRAASVQPRTSKTTPQMVVPVFSAFGGFWPARRSTLFLCSSEVRSGRWRGMLTGTCCATPHLRLLEKSKPPMVRAVTVEQTEVKLCVPQQGHLLTRRTHPAHWGSDPPPPHRQWCGLPRAPWCWLTRTTAEARKRALEGSVLCTRSPCMLRGVGGLFDRASAAMPWRRRVHVQDEATVPQDARPERKTKMATPLT